MMTTTTKETETMNTATDTETAAKNSYLLRYAVDSLGTAFVVGDVVRYADRRRRYVVTFVCPTSRRVNLSALSGGFAGSGPSGVDGADLVVLDEDVTFTGAKAKWLRDRAARRTVSIAHLEGGQPVGIAAHHLVKGWAFCQG